MRSLPAAWTIRGFTSVAPTAPTAAIVEASFKNRRRWDDCAEGDSAVMTGSRQGRARWGRRLLCYFAAWKARNPRTESALRLRLLVSRPDIAAGHKALRTMSPH